MPTALAFRHLPYEDLGAFHGALSAAGYTVAYNDTPLDGVDHEAARAADLLIALGGPFGAYETATYPYLADEIAILRARLAEDRPTLGVCLGAQLIAAALDARVYPGPAMEIGWAPVELTRAGRAGPLAPLEGVPILHWHGDTFELPAGCELLASTHAYAHQAFARGSRLLALQCHPEADGRGFEHWILGKDRSLARQGLTVPGLRAEAARHGPAAGHAGAAMLTRWLGGLG